MRATYIAHSGFYIEGEKTCLLIDYYRGQLPAFSADKQLIVLASHRHHDHFDPVIFTLPATAWILGRDFSLSPGMRTKYALSDEAFERCRRIKTDEILQTGGVLIRALRSTDEGAAFLIEIEGKTIYHAGDLNQWVWREDENYDRQMSADYLHEIEKLKNTAIDAAFLPVDPRQSEDFYLGADNFIRMHRPKLVFPMHLWDDYATIDRFAAHPCARDYRDSIIRIQKEGERFEI